MVLGEFWLMVLPWKWLMVVPIATLEMFHRSHFSPEHLARILNKSEELVHHICPSV